MTRFFQYLNFIGVLALIGLCCIQWRTNRQLNLQAIDLEKTRLQQTAQIAEQDKTIKGYAEDLEDFRRRLELSESAFKEVEQKLDAMTAERDRLKIELDKWIVAVAERDAALKQASEQMQKLIAARDDAIEKFNELAVRYNKIVK
jgi:chromosome segregation ATPase